MSRMVEFSPRLRVVPGCFHGIGHSCLVGRVRVKRGVSPSADVRAILGSDVEDPPAAQTLGQSVEETLLRRVLARYVSLNWQARLPVDERMSVVRVRQADGWVEFEFVVGTWGMEASRVVIQWIQDRVNANTECPPEDVQAMIESVRPHGLQGVNAFSVALAALRLGIPIQRITHDVFLVGTGSRSRWIKSTTTDRTSAISVAFAGSKYTTAALLRKAGLPGAEHVLVNSLPEAIEAANALGFPLVVKPDNQEQGRGVAAGLMSLEQVETAYAHAATFSKKVLVERYAPGYTHRLTVAYGQVIRVVKRVPGGVTGDGASTVSHLVEALKDTHIWRERLRVNGLLGPTLDSEALELLSEQGLAPESVVEAGRFVRLRRRDNFSAGGTNEELALNDVHPDNLRLAIETAALLRLDMAGIDFITPDIRSSWLHSQGTICEVNAMPQLYAATADRIYEGVLARLFPQGATVPAVLRILAQPCDLRDVEAAMRVASESGCNAVSSRLGIHIDGQQATLGFENGYKAALASLMRADVTGVVCLMSADEVLQNGLPLARSCWQRIEFAPPQPGQQPTLSPAELSVLRALLAADPSHPMANAHNH